MRLPNKQLASGDEGVRAKNVVTQGGDGTLYERSTTAVRWRRIGDNRKVAKEKRERNKIRIPDQQEIHLGRHQERGDSTKEKKTRKALMMF